MKWTQILPSRVLSVVRESLVGHGTAQSPAMVMTSDFTRTSTSVFTNISIHDGDPEYKCTATYDPVITGASFAMTASQEFTVDFQCKLCVPILNTTPHVQFM